METFDWSYVNEIKKGGRMNKGVIVLAIMLGGVELTWSQQTTEFQLAHWAENETEAAGMTAITDSLYHALQPGSIVRVRLLNEAERSKPEPERALLSFKRAEALLTYYQKNGYNQQEFEVEMVPFHQPNRLRTSEITSRSYRSFMSRKSESFFIISKLEVRVTSNAAVNFDSDIKNEMETFSVYPSRDQYVYLNSGTVIYIPGGTLKTDNGMSPECDMVEVRVAEYSQLEAMALKSMTTSSSGKRLETGGMWYVGFYCNGKSLKPGVGEYYYIRTKFTGEPRDMKVFTGDVKNKVIDWRQQTDGSVSTISSQEAMGSGSEKANLWIEDREYDGVYMAEETDGYYEKDMYELKLNDVGWINCDAFYEVMDKTDLLVNCDTTGRVNVMLIFKDRKSVLPGYQCDNTTQIKFSNIAANELAVLVVFRKNKDNTVDKFVKTILPANQKTIDATAWKSSNVDDLRTDIYAQLSDF